MYIYMQKKIIIWLLIYLIEINYRLDPVISDANYKRIRL
jgi:hypothetical protein